MPLGSVHLTVVTRRGVQSFGGPAEVDYVSILKRPVKSGATAGRADVAIYSASWCGPCKSAKTWMTSQNIPFTDYDVETNEQGKRNFQAMGARGDALSTIRSFFKVIDP